MEITGKGDLMGVARRYQRVVSERHFFKFYFILTYFGNTHRTDPQGTLPIRWMEIKGKRNLTGSGLTISDSDARKIFNFLFKHILT